MDRQTPLSLPRLDQAGEIEHGPAVTASAIRMQFVGMAVQTADAAEIDHAAQHVRDEGQDMSPTPRVAMDGRSKLNAHQRKTP